MIQKKRKSGMAKIGRKIRQIIRLSNQAPLRHDSTTKTTQKTKTKKMSQWRANFKKPCPALCDSGLLMITTFAAMFVCSLGLLSLWVLGVFFYADIHPSMQVLFTQHIHHLKANFLQIIFYLTFNLWLAVNGVVLLCALWLKARFRGVSR